jgi:hypothetical protein
MICKCGSYAINHHLHGRDGSRGDLCDVCFWREKATALEAHAARLEAIGDVFLKTLADSLEDPLHWNDDAAQAEKDWTQAKEAKP